MANALIRPAEFGVIFDGQSLNGIPAAPGSLFAYPRVVMAARPAGVFVEPWQGGYAWNTLDGIWAERCAAYCSMASTVIYVGVGGTTDYSLGRSGTNTVNSQISIADKVRAINPAALVIATTTTPSANITANEGSVQSNTKRLAGNTILTTSTSLVVNGGDFDAVVDLANHADLNDETDTGFYSDGTHWNPAGCAVAAGLIGAAIDTLLAA
jgi:hypothetical protein